MARRKQKKESHSRRQAWGVLLLGVALLLFLAIVSFNVNDPVQLNVEGNRIQVHNWLGPLGSSVAYFLMQWTFGYPIIVLPLFLALLALRAIQKKPFAGLGHTLWIFTAWALLISIFLALPEAFRTSGQATEYYPSGLIGGWMASHMVIYLSKFGSLAVLIVLSIALLIVSVRIEISHLIESGASLWKGFITVLMRLLDHTVTKLNAWKAKRSLRKAQRKAQRDEKQREKETAPAPETTDFAEPQPKLPPEIRIRDDDIPVRKPIQPEKKDALSPSSSGETESTDTGNMIQTDLDEILASLDRHRMKKQPDNDPDSESAEPGGQQKMDFEVRGEQKDAEVDYDQMVKESIARYTFPSIDILDDPPEDEATVTRDELRSNAELLELKLLDFGVKAKVIRVTAGPVITLYELQPAPGVKVSSIVNLANDLALAMEARGIRIIAPIPGKAAVGIEIPNRNPQIVLLKSLIRSEKFSKSDFELPLALGKTINGESYIADLTKMPHVLIAGSTGSGKSVGINTIIMSLIYAVNPAKVKFMMIDPKKLELSLYRDLRDHYLIWRPDLDEEVITKPSNAVSMLNSIVLEMEKRYDRLAGLGVRSIIEFNEKVQQNPKHSKDANLQELPYIVVIVDELADLMMVAAKEVETPIARLAQMARAVGIHLIVATQRPSVDVITGMIKANFPARIAYQVATKVDSRTVLDMNGAEQLLGNGDMLYLPPGSPKPARLQNPFISTDEVSSVITHVRRQPKMPYYSIPQPKSGRSGVGDAGSAEERDALYEDARAIVVQHNQGSISFLQRRLKIGYSRAARLMDELEEDGIVGPADGSKPREVLITLQQLQEMQ